MEIITECAGHQGGVQDVQVDGVAQQIAHLQQSQLRRGLAGCFCGKWPWIVVKGM